MSTKQAIARRYQAIVDHATLAVARQAYPPTEGWIATTRKALGMSAAQLGRRLGVTRARISQAELAEPSGGVTLRTMQAAAQAMGCRFVYAIVPNEGSVEDAIAAQAHEKARAIVARAGVHMALERQSLPEAKNRDEVERIASEFIRAMPRDLWADP
jgi:predicted DNA-binding mobile mystery protein A